MNSYDRGSDSKWCKVNKDLRVNERKLSEMLKEGGKEVESYIKDKFDKLIDLYEGNFNDGNRN